MRARGQGSAPLCVFAAPLALAVVALAAASCQATTQPAQLVLPDKVFPADAVINVTLPPYSVIPNDGKDDTAALQKAITATVDTGRFLYFPAGVYNISDSLVARNAEGLWRPHLTLQGQHRNKVTLKLADGAPGFNDPKVPKAMLVTGSVYEPGDATDGGGNKAFRNNVFDMTFDSGRGNAGAVGIDWAVSNIGSIENVSVTSGDGTGSAGIALRRRIPGPGFIKNVSVSGFDYGIDIDDIQYGLTLDTVCLQKQQIAGIRNSKNLLHIRNLTSNNTVPEVVVTGREGVLTLLDSHLSGPSHKTSVICDGTAFVRGIRFRTWDNSALKGGPVNWIDRGQKSRTMFSANTNLGWPLIVPPKDGAPVYRGPNEYAAVGARRAGEADDTAAIQRAIDAGKPIVYFPTGRTYFISDTVIVRGKVRQILGMGSEISLGAAKAPFSDTQNPRPLFRLDPTDAPELFLESMFFNAQYPGEVIFENNTTKTVVIRHCSGWVGSNGQRRSYRNTPNATGPVFVEDVFLPGWNFNKQQVFAWQFNPENWDSSGAEPQVMNAGGRLWILGFKTEGAAPFIETVDGTTELLGAYNYVSATKEGAVPTGSVPYIVTDSAAMLTFTTDNFRDNDYKVYIRDYDKGTVRTWTRDQLEPRNGNKGDRSVAVTGWTNCELGRPARHGDAFGGMPH